MSDHVPRGVPRLSSPDAAASDANSSVHVNIDARSNRGETQRTAARSPSPAINPEGLLSRQQTVATTTARNSSLFLSPSSSQSSSQQDVPIPPVPAEQLLFGLINSDATTSPVAGSISGSPQGSKRPRDGDIAAGEPSAKRDKLTEELEEMAARHRAVQDEEAQLISTLTGTEGPQEARDFSSTIPSVSSVLEDTNGLYALSGESSTAENDSSLVSGLNQLSVGRGAGDSGRRILALRPVRRRRPQSGRDNQASPTETNAFDPGSPDDEAIGLEPL